MKQYTSLFRIRFIHGLQYRAAALSALATNFAWGMLRILLYNTLYLASPDSFGVPFGDLTAYVWLQQAFLAMFVVWFYDTEIFDQIMNGNIAYELARPVDLYWVWMSRTMAMRLSKTMLRCFIVLLGAYVLPSPYNLPLPQSFAAAFGFIGATLLGFSVLSAFSMLVYISAFYTLNASGIRRIINSFTDFLSGAIIPLIFMPERAQRVIRLLPFASVLDVPVRIYSGNIPAAEILPSLLPSVIWLVALVLIGRGWMRKSIHRVTAQGG